MNAKTLMFSLMVLIFMSSTGSAVTEVGSGNTFPYTMSIAGETYVLTENISTSGTALNVGASNVTFNGNGHTITFATSSNAPCITNWAQTGFVLHDINLVSTNVGTATHGVSQYVNCRFYNLSVSTVGGYGLSLTNNSGSVLENITCVSTNAYPLYLRNTKNTTVSRCSADAGPQIACYVYNCTNTSIIESNIKSVNHNGMYINISNNISIIDTECNSTGSYATWVGYSDVHIYGGEANSRDAISTYLGYSNNSTISSYATKSISTFGLYAMSCNNISFSDVTCESTNTSGIKLSKVYNSTFVNTVVQSPYATTVTGGKLHVLCLGDSITEGSQAANVSGGYAKYYNLGDNYVVSNQGVGGDRAEWLLPMVDAKLDIFNPDIVTIMIGLNDVNNDRTVDETVNDTIAIADIVKAHGATPIICTVLPHYVTNTSTLDKALTTAANNKGYRVINSYDAIDSNPENGVYDAYVNSWYIDGGHPNVDGNKLIGAYVGRNINAIFSTYIGTGLNQTIGFNGETVSISRDIYSTDTLVPFAVTPTEDWVRVNVTSWATGSKIWSESMDSSDGTTSHIIGSFPVNSEIQIVRDGIDYERVISNETGYINWTYSGGFSDHTFEAYVRSESQIMKTDANDMWMSWVSMLGMIIVIVMTCVIIMVVRNWEMNMNLAISSAIALMIIMAVIYFGYGILTSMGEII